MKKENRGTIQGVVVQDVATQWIQSYPCKTKTSQDRTHLDPGENPKEIFTDNSLEFGKACEYPQLNQCASTRHRSETMGTAERVVRRVKEGTSS